MNEVAVRSSVLYGWAAGPVDDVADSLDSAYTTLTRGEGSGPEGGTAIGAVLAEITAPDGGWGRDQRFVRGRVYDLAGGLVDCGRDYDAGDTANAANLDGFFESEYGDGAEPAELGGSPRYRD